MAELEKQKAEMLAMLESWSPARLAYCSVAGEWSVAQVLDHLVKTETGIMGTVQRNLGSPHKIGIRDRVGFRFIESVFRSTRKVKVPAAAARMLPGADPDVPDIVRRWSDCRRGLAGLLAALAPEQLQGGVFRHPVAGWMSVPQVVSFFSVHMVHHGFQIGRLAEASRGL